MPRHARLDVPGVLQHVIVRGIERRKIFVDDRDRGAFVARLNKVLEETDTACLAWALLPNHFHLLLRPRRDPLARCMRRLLTGYAVSFNLRHKRVGHLFQNRYKSIVCEEDAYLLELIRYIHLNPLRAGLVSGMAGLDRYPWSGHAVLMGKAKFAAQQVEEVLTQFGRTVSEARRDYRVFIEAGIALGRQDRLVGGGLARSTAGDDGEGQREGQAPPAYDERVLGGSEFIETLWRHEELRGRLGPRLSVEETLGRVAALFGEEPKALLRRGNRKSVAEGRSVVCFLAVRELGHTGVAVGRVLHLKRAGVSLAAKRGEQVLANRPGLREAVLGEGS